MAKLFGNRITEAIGTVRAWKAKRANDKTGKVTSGRETPGERDRSFRESKGG